MMSAAMRALPFNFTPFESSSLLFAGNILLSFSFVVCLYWGWELVSHRQQMLVGLVSFVVFFF